MDHVGPTMARFPANQVTPANMRARADEAGLPMWCSTSPQTMSTNPRRGQGTQAPTSDTEVEPNSARSATTTAAAAHALTTERVACAGRPVAPSDHRPRLTGPSSPPAPRTVNRSGPSPTPHPWSHNSGARARGAG